MSGFISDYKISNIIGTKLPPWLVDQLKTRSEKSSMDVRDNPNLVYNANKTAWVRLVSSINTPSKRDMDYFSRLGVDMSAKELSLAQQFVLFGGTSKYLNNQKGLPNYQLREGFKQTYSVLGENEVNQFGYRPMPGISAVTIETQGRLGSVRQAVVNFKCWDKFQLDVIDALYFKLGFTMFLEWGHTYYYSSQNPNVLQTTEQYALDPFTAGLSKEQIFRHISQKSRESEGNYDAMLGIVTNFNFSYNQEGGFDCSLRILSLGVLGDSIKINHTKVLQNILDQQIKQYNTTLRLIDENEARKRKLEEDLLNKQNEDDLLTFDELIKAYPSGLKEFPDSKGNKNYFVNTKNYSEVLAIDRLNGIIPTEENYLLGSTVTLDRSKLYGIFANKKINFGDDTYGTYDESVIDVLKNSLSQYYKDTSVLNKAKDILLAASTIGIYYLLYSVTKNASNPDSSQEIAYNSTKFTYPEIEYQTPSRYFYINLKRNFFATVPDSEIYKTIDGVQTKIDSKDQFRIVYNSEFEPNLFNFLGNDQSSITIKSIEKTTSTLEDVTSTFPKIVISFNLPIYNVKSNNQDKAYPVVYSGDKELGGGATKKSQYEERLPYYLLPVEIEITDTWLIKSFSLEGVKQTKDFLPQEENPQTKNQDSTPPQDTNSEQEDSPLKSLSSLELALRTIQIHSLIKAIQKSGNNINIGLSVQKIDLTDPADKSPSGETFIKQLFSNGIFSEFIDKLIDSSAYTNLSQESYQTADEKIKLIIHSKYGFATNFMAAKAPIEEFSPVNFKKLLTTYVIPYEINQSIEDGTSLNHPVYMPLGQLLMLLNHNCTIYDTAGKAQTPLVYIDFNPNVNYCLSNGKHLSTDPFKVLIPFEGTNSDFYALFDSDVKAKGKNNEIRPASGSTQNTPIFNTEQNDYLSGAILNFKYDFNENSQDQFNPYRGKIMNILLNIDYIMEVIKQFSSKDQENKVYLKPLLEQILSDMNKSLGNYNIFRLSYNDSGNVFQIIDDQLIPVNDTGERQLLRSEVNEPLPLFGLKSIAKNLEIKSEVSTKLANMLAVSANANLPSKSTLSNDGTSFGFVNYDFVDRYIPQRTEVTSSNSGVSDAAIKAAIQFNSAIKSFYYSINPAQNQVGFATNYYIERMTQIKGNDSASRSSAMIPVSVNFTTNGISGMNMYQSFTIPENLLPYTYTSARPVVEKELNKVGFVIVGLSHTIQNNTWDTSVRANMIFLKNTEDYKSEKEVQKTQTGVFTGFIPRVSDTLGRAGIRDAAFKETGFKEALEKTAANIGANYNDLLGVMRAESGVDPKAVNPLGGASGLIQFMPATAKELGTSVEAIRNMTAIEQLVYVEKYYKQAKSRVGDRVTKDKYGLYGYTFLPAMVKRLDDYNFRLEFPGLSARVISENNPGIARAAGKTPGEFLTVGDFIKYVSIAIPS